MVALPPPDQLARYNGLRMSLPEGVKLVAPLTGAALFAVYVLTATAATRWPRRTRPALGATDQME